MTTKAFVLMSGGIDSTVCFFLAKRDHGENVTGISVNYGQRHNKEIQYARESCHRAGLPHHELSVRNIIPRTMLTDATAAVPNISYDEITGVSPTYVPFRNGLMLSVLTSYVQDHNGESYIYFGAHAEDARNWAYPDCTPEFVGAMANAIYIGTYRQTRLLVPLQYMNKSEIIDLGDVLGVDWRNTWSCYKGEELHCGTCPTCRARRSGFEKACVVDPTRYASDRDAA